MAEKKRKSLSIVVKFYRMANFSKNVNVRFSHTPTGKGLDRKKRFFFGLIVVSALFFIPTVATVSVNAFQWLILFLCAYSICVYMVYRMTIRNIKPKYPIVNPEGHPDIYSGRMPRPLYEDMQRYPWFFRNKKKKKKDTH